MSHSMQEFRSREWLTLIPEEVFLCVFFFASAAPILMSSLRISFMTFWLLLGAMHVTDFVRFFGKTFVGSFGFGLSSFLFFAGDSRRVCERPVGLGRTSRGNTFELLASITMRAFAARAESCVSRAYLQRGDGWLVEALLVAVAGRGLLAPVVGQGDFFRVF